MKRKTGTLYVLPAIPDDAPDTVKNALAIRNAASANGVCPSCGATPYLWQDNDGITHLTFEHEEGCGCFTDAGTTA